MRMHRKFKQTDCQTINCNILKNPAGLKFNLGQKYRWKIDNVWYQIKFQWDWPLSSRPGRKEIRRSARISSFWSRSKFHTSFSSCTCSDIYIKSGTYCKQCLFALVADLFWLLRCWADREMDIPGAECGRPHSVPRCDILFPALLLDIGIRGA